MLKCTHCENQWYIYKYTWPNQIMLGLTRFMNIEIFCTDLTKTRSSSNSLWIINGNISSFGLTKTRLCWLNRVVWQMKMKKYVHETICKTLLSRPLKFFFGRLFIESDSRFLEMIMLSRVKWMQTPIWRVTVCFSWNKSSHNERWSSLGSYMESKEDFGTAN